MKSLKQTRAVTYRRYGVPALILEGRWLTEKYRLEIGDQVDIDYQPNEIRLRKNTKLSIERRKQLKNIKSIVYDDETRDQKTSEGQSDEHSG